MEYKRIIAITGLGGLFELVTSKSDGAIVRSLDDKTTRFVSSRVHNFSNLESIEIFTVSNNVNLAEVFISMKKGEQPMPDAGAEGKDLKDYFQAIVPGIDLERVYASDMKKIIKWYGILTANNVEVIAPAQDSEEETLDETPVEIVEAEQPVTEEPVVDQTKQDTPGDDETTENIQEPALEETTAEKPAPKKRAAKK